MLVLGSESEFEPAVVIGDHDNPLHQVNMS